jgi:hypothetical protein
MWFAWHMRRSTAAAVQRGLSFGKLILLGSTWKCLCLLSDGVVLLSDIARPHTAQQARNLLQTSGWETLDHLLYSPDFAPRNFCLFPAMQECLSEHGFTGDEDIKARYYHMADTTGTCVLCVQNGQTVDSAWVVKRTKEKKSIAITPSLCIVCFLY